MDIHEFGIMLAAHIELEAPLASLKNEKQFEEQHIIGAAWRLAQEYPEVRIFVHPWNRTDRCTPSCDVGWTDASRRLQGCPRCWEKSKKWSMVRAFGTQNNFDLVGMDRNQKTLALEIKWLTLSSRGPNSEFQRFIGQCSLGAAVHDLVLGVCAFRCQRKKPLDQDDAKVRETLQKIGVQLVLLHAATEQASG